MTSPSQTISSILKHDRKVNSYKIALVRAINDVVLNFPDLASPDLATAGQDVAVPLKMLAELWLAYYWPFADPEAPILQGAVSVRAGVTRNDFTFRPELTTLRRQWDELQQTTASPADGFLLFNEMRVPRRRDRYGPAMQEAYQKAVRKATGALKLPIRYAGPGDTTYSVFDPPQRFADLPTAVAVPGTQPADRCLVIRAELWQTFRSLSLWIEALCLHEWCLFTESLSQSGAHPADRGDVYRLLTARPDNRRPLTWERNQVDLLLREGKVFHCPWTQRRIVLGTEYALDHLLPVSVYPINEIWNLVPSDPWFNSHDKRDRLPSFACLQQAEPHLVSAYGHYCTSATLRPAFREDTRLRFSAAAPAASNLPIIVAHAVIDLLDQFAELRSLTRFSSCK